MTIPVLHRRKQRLRGSSALPEATRLATAEACGSTRPEPKALASLPPQGTDGFDVILAL